MQFSAPDTTIAKNGTVILKVSKKNTVFSDPFFFSWAKPPFHRSNLGLCYALQGSIPTGCFLPDMAFESRGGGVKSKRAPAMAPVPYAWALILMPFAGKNGHAVPCGAVHGYGLVLTPGRRSDIVPDVVPHIKKSVASCRFCRGPTTFLFSTAFLHATLCVSVCVCVCFVVAISSATWLCSTCLLLFTS